MPVGKTSWALFVGVVGIMSVLKPILQLPKAIERYSKLHIAYCELGFAFRDLVDEVQSTGGITQTIMDSRAKADGRLRELALQDSVTPNRLLRKCQSDVKRRIPSFDSWCPKTQ
jgi:hypothetical protein